MPPPGAGGLPTAEVLVPGSRTAALSEQVDVTVHEVLQAAVEATGATYGAFGVLDDTGAAFERFVVVGMDAAVRKQIDQLPVGGGVLGVLLERPEPLRLADLTAHPRAVGFPAGHPTMHSFLGVPVRVDGAVFGHLFLTVKRGGAAFTEADEAAATALAAAAGLAIGNAELVERAEHRRAWAQAGTDIATALLSGADPDTVLRSIGERVAGLASADAAAVLAPREDDDALTVVVAVGPDKEEVDSIEGVRIPVLDTQLGAAHRPGVPWVVDDVRAHMGDKVYKTVIPRNVRVSEAPSHGKPALLYDLKCAGSQAYLRLASEVIQRERALRAA